MGPGFPFKTTLKRSFSSPVTGIRGRATIRTTDGHSTKDDPDSRFKAYGVHGDQTPLLSPSKLRIFLCRESSCSRPISTPATANPWRRSTHHGGFPQMRLQCDQPHRPECSKSKTQERAHTRSQEHKREGSLNHPTLAHRAPRGLRGVGTVRPWSRFPKAATGWALGLLCGWGEGSGLVGLGLLRGWTFAPW